MEFTDSLLAVEVLAVTTTASSVLAFTSSITFNSFSIPAETSTSEIVFVVYPTALNSSEYFFPVTSDKEKRPSKSDIVPAVEPPILIVTPDNASFLLFVTFPPKRKVCAKTVLQKRLTIKRRPNALKNIHNEFDAKVCPPCYQILNRMLRDD